MATPVIMPKFGMAQEDGTILRWLKQEGERVEKGEVLLEVLTDKIDMEVEAPASGILRDIRYGVDAVVPVTTVIAEIADSVEEARIAAAAPVAPELERALVSPVAQRMAAEQGIDLAQIVGSGLQGRITKADVQRAVPQPATPARRRATPAARKLAKAAGLDLAGLGGSGPQGRIQAGDVTAALSERPPQQPMALPRPDASATTGTPLRGRRRTIATRLAQSWQTIPHIFLTTHVDMTQAEAARAALGRDVEMAGAKLTPTALVARATVAALTRHRLLNSTLQEQGADLLLTEHAEVALGLAVALGDGLIVPVVRDAGKLGLAELAVQMADLAERARAGQLQPDEVAGATFTLSNLGMFPIDQFTALINPPQVAILAVGRMQTEPVWDGAAFQPRPVLHLTLSADHRAVDGAVAAAFLAEVRQLLEEPLRLLL